MRELDESTARGLLPPRDPEGHKGSFGKVLLLCGSRGFTGAAWFAAMGALRSGAGLVYLGVPESIYAIEAMKLNEPVIFPLPEENGTLGEAAIPEILDRLPQMDAALLGCGLGQSDGVRKVAEAVLDAAACPVVLDADGINVLARHKDVLRRRNAPTVLTPHDGEFARMGGDLHRDRVESTVELARELGCIVLRKGCRTLITDGEVCYRNTTGNSGMAAGGSGDVLAGILTALLGQGMKPLKAAACAAWFHGAAGDLAAQRLGEYGMLPTDLLEDLPRLLR